MASTLFIRSTARAHSGHLRSSIYASSFVLVIIALTACVVAYYIWDGSAHTPQRQSDSTDYVVGEASWPVYYESIGRLVDDADLVLMGTVTGVVGTSEEVGEPMGDAIPLIVSTHYSISVNQIFRRSIASADEIIVTQTGGSAGDRIYETADDPLFAVGDTYLMFVREGGVDSIYDNQFVVLGGPQGRMVVEDDKVWSLSEVYADRQIVDLGIAGTTIDEIERLVRASEVEP